MGIKNYCTLRLNFGRFDRSMCFTDNVKNGLYFHCGITYNSLCYFLSDVIVTEERLTSIL